MKNSLFLKTIFYTLCSLLFPVLLWAQGTEDFITEFTLKLKPNASIESSSIISLNNNFNVKKTEKIFRMTKERYNRLFKDKTYIDALGNERTVPDLSRWYKIILNTPYEFDNVEKEYKNDSSIENIHKSDLDYSLPAETIPNEYTDRAQLAAEQWSLDKISYYSAVT